jgi:hypothetical protein
MKAKVFQAVPFESLAAFVPKALQPRMPHSLPKSGTCSVVRFPLCDGIIHSTPLRRALRGVKQDTDPVVIIAAGLTKEAKDIIALRNGVIISRDEWYWTDESHSAIKAIMNRRDRYFSRRQFDRGRNGELRLPTRSIKRTRTPPPARGE